MKKLAAGSMLFPLIFGSIGIVLLLAAGLVAYFTIQGSSAAAARLAAIQVVGLGLLEDSPVGREVIIEGKISNRMPTIRGDLVAYVEQRTVEDSDGDTSTVTDADVRPPLLVDTVDGQLEVRDYTLSTGRTEDGDRARSTRYGVAAGDAVVVGGFVARGAELPTLERATLLDPPAEAYLDLVGLQSSGGWVAVIICGVLGLLFSGLAVAFFFAFRNTQFV